MDKRSDGIDGYTFLNSPVHHRMAVGAYGNQVFDGVHNVVAAAFREGDQMVDLDEILSNLSIDFLETHSADLTAALILRVKTLVVVDALSTGIPVSFIADAAYFIFPALVEGEVFIRYRIVRLGREVVFQVEPVPVCEIPSISFDCP